MAIPPNLPSLQIESAASVLAKVREYIVDHVESILSHPQTECGDADACEGEFIYSLELLHLIDYPHCETRCGWNCYVNYVSKKYQSRSSLAFIIFSNSSSKNWVEVANRMIPDLQTIWYQFKNRHPHQFT